MKWLWILLVCGICYANENFNYSKTIDRFFELMVSGQSVLFMDEGVLEDGILISEYKIQEIKKEPNNILIAVINYTRVGSYSVDHYNLKIEEIREKLKEEKLIGKYQFQIIGPDQLRFIEGFPAKPLLLTKSAKNKIK
ncbi:MAG: hypothetical protein A2381_01735 [Bdellovibrionales bacterium RIFOXYB1_FULL_37_110]|nr:MAG: hypothetical protein A2417_15780 [Bdellovibrionales bacterium RIFOXYC1_FULL_37_79]OFZ58936.1 MAG: hypothetical protein A2381_01735 [Bdellovibrionales bacterium RIFOXYB1_FULL_37_110]OFZ64618.1 MAG: hypothetical protein A2577_13200 [Bdellovibrionales bacterium RIFOXYD1_FULL_36_51]